MTPIIVEGSGGTTVGFEELTLDDLELNASPFNLVGFEHKPAKKLLEWVKGADADGAKLLRLARYEQAEITLQLRVEQQADMDDALDVIGQVLDKLQEAERQAAGGGRGLELVWNPAGATFTGTFYVQAGEIDVPKAPESNEKPYLWRRPVINLTLTCDPFIYGVESTLASVTSSLPLITATVEGVAGDVPAEATFRVTDAAGQARDYVAIGLENFHYGAGPALLIDSDSFVTTGFAGSQTTRAGAYDVGGGNSVVRATLTTTPVAVCSSAELTHIGTFRNTFRLWPSSLNLSVRMAWRQGRDQWTTEPWVQAPFEDAWWEVDLGQSRIREAALGTQTWQWRLEAKSTAAGDTVDVDIHEMVPSGEGYGKARRTLPLETPKLLTAYDTFVQTAGSLAGKTAPVGGTWVVAGNAFSVNATDKVLERTGATAGGGWAHLNGVSLTDTIVQADVKIPNATAVAAGVQARRDGGNYVEARLSGDDTVDLIGEIPTSVGLGTAPFKVQSETWYSIRLVIEGDNIYVWVWPRGSEPSAPLIRTVNTTVGALAAGSAGPTALESGTTTTRQHDNFFVGVPTSDAVVFASRSAEFRSYGDDPLLREDSTGTYWGRPPESRGGRLWLPPAGDQARTTRVAVLPRRKDIETLPSEGITDSTSLVVKGRPRWIAIPRVYPGLPAPETILGTAASVYRAEVEAGPDGTVLPQVTDLTSNNRHLPQATVGMRPLKKAAIVNSKAVYRFDGTDDYVQGTFPLTQTWEMWMVVKLRSASSGSVRRFFGGQVGSVLRGTFDNSANGPVTLYSGGSFVSSSGSAGESGLTGAFHLLHFVSAGASSKIRMDGVEIASGDAGATNHTALSIASDGSGVQNGNIDTPEFWVSTRLTTTQERADLLAYCQETYATP